MRIPAPAPAPLDLTDPDVLAATLRTEPHRALADDGPIVFFDFDTGTLETLCDRRAHERQDEWSAMLADPARGAASCGRGPSAMTCMQISERPLLILHFTLEPPVRPTTAMMGSTPTANSINGQALKHAAQTARCP